MSIRPAADLSGVTVVIPCYDSAQSISAVVKAIPSGIGSIICVNDGSTDNLGEILAGLAKLRPRVTVITHRTNKGVGGATTSNS